jgi:hypothetical protein
MVGELLARIARALDAAEIPYMVIDGQAVLVYGYTRLTDDIDITLGVGPDRLKDVLHVIERADLRSLVDDDFVEQKLVLPAEDRRSKTRVDLIFSYGGYEAEAIRRARPVEIAGYEVAYAAVEDVLIHKVVAGRPQDLRDAVEILLRHLDAVDSAYVQGWLRQFEEAPDMALVPTFQRLLAEARG